MLRSGHFRPMSRTLLLRVGKRVLNNVIGKHLMPGPAAECGDVAEIALYPEGAQVLDRAFVRKVPKALGPEKFGPKLSMVLILDRRIAGRKYELCADREPELMLGNGEERPLGQQLEVVEACQLGPLLR